MAPLFSRARRRRRFTTYFDAASSPVEALSLPLETMTRAIHAASDHAAIYADISI